MVVDYKAHHGAREDRVVDRMGTTTVIGWTLVAFTVGVLVGKRSEQRAFKRRILAALSRKRGVPEYEPNEDGTNPLRTDFIE